MIAEMIVEQKRKPVKKPLGAERPFPRICRHCGEREVNISAVTYHAEVRHDGSLHAFTVPKLKQPVCGACGERVYTEDVNAQVLDGLRAHLGLLTPARIQQSIADVDMTQRQVAALLGIAEQTLSRWLNGLQIQTKSMDNLMRVFFANPQQVRDVLQEANGKPAHAGATNGCPEDNWNDLDRQLFEELRNLRRRLAEEKDVKPYQIFWDKALCDMVRIRPRTLDEFREIKGVGEKKMVEYGPEFVEVIGKCDLDRV